LAPMMRRSTRNLDDDEEDINDFDPAYFPKRVYKDGRGPRVRLMLTDAAPPPRRAVFDARNHQPHYAEITDEAANRRAVESYEAHKRWLQDAWRGPNAQPPDNGGGDDDDDESPRDRYVRRLQGACRTPIGSHGGGADAVEAQRRRWNAEIPAKDAALADRDAYGEYLDYLQNAWKRPCGVVAGGRR
jgi:hypothetical protein